MAAPAGDAAHALDRGLDGSLHVALPAHVGQYEPRGAARRLCAAHRFLQAFLRTADVSRTTTWGACRRRPRSAPSCSSARLLVCHERRDHPRFFLRHGRFDCVLPIGPPDDRARTALWESCLARASTEADSAALATASEGFTPADIAHVARTVSQVQFGRTLDTGARARSTTEDHLRTVGETRPTVSATTAQEFARQTEKFARIQNVLPDQAEPVAVPSSSASTQRRRESRSCRSLGPGPFTNGPVQ
ncbi:hypothetical protein [Streptomyces sp. NPDC059389]|uniref:hypothetical protein n=1 Tax=Streptomyces sp. NPDC059389 TaxID=3346818 RepID=UPI0036BE2911